MTPGGKKKYSVLLRARVESRKMSEKSDSEASDDVTMVSSPRSPPSPEQVRPGNVGELCDICAEEFADKSGSFSGGVSGALCEHRLLTM